MIKEYINKDGKKMYRIVNHYIGTREYNGKEKRINKKGFTSKKEAEIYIARELTNFQENEKYNVNTLNSKITFQQLTELWFEQHKITVRESSVLNIRATIKLINTYFPNCEVKKITLPMIQKLINETSQIYSKSYIGKIKATIGAILDYAVKCDLINKNVAKLVKLPRMDEQKEYKEKFYTREELQEFLEIVKNNYSLDEYLIFRLLAYTGARKGEIMALTWNDIDLKTCTIVINKTLAYSENYKVCINEPKTKSSNRIISIDKETINILKQFKISKKIFNIDNNIFGYHHMNYINIRLKNIYNKFPHLKKISPHGFRHTHASLLFEAGASFKEVQERLGHSDIKMTMNIYTHVTKKQTEKTANTFANFMAL